MLSRLEKGKYKKGKPEEGNPWASGLAKLAVDLGANRFPDTSMGCPVGFMVGVWVMFGVVIGQGFWIQHPSSIETGFGMHGIEATRSAYPSFWPGGGQLFCW
jgi:hypothetical protein